MKLATIRTPAGTRAVRIDDTHAVETGHDDVRALLTRPNWRAAAEQATGPRHELAAIDYAPLIPEPQKIICVGHNYREHVREMGHELPTHPTIFAKFAPALVGARDPIVLPRASEKVDWEAELAVVIGSPVRHATPETAAAAIAGYTVLNDVSVRDYQYRTGQFLQGKTFDRTTPIGPWLVTPDELPEGGWAISTTVDGELMQSSTTADMVFGPVDLVVYVSAIVTLVPGDVIATGTPSGVGHARKPPRYLRPGNELVTTIAGVGELRNRCVAEDEP